MISFCFRLLISFPFLAWFNTRMSKATVLLPLLSLSMTVELGSAHKQWSAFRGMFKRIKYATPSRGDPGQPLFLTPYIESGRTEEGRNNFINDLPRNMTFS